MFHLFLDAHFLSRLSVHAGPMASFSRRRHSIDRGIVCISDAISLMAGQAAWRPLPHQGLIMHPSQSIRPAITSTREEAALLYCKETETRPE